VIGVVVAVAVAFSYMFSRFSEFRYATGPWMDMGPRFYEFLTAVLLVLIPLWVFVAAKQDRGRLLYAV